MKLNDVVLVPQGPGNKFILVRVEKLPKTTEPSATCIGRRLGSGQKVTFPTYCVEKTTGVK